MYLTWSAMTNNPDPNCKVDLASKVFGSFNQTSAAPSPGEAVTPSMDTSGILGLIVWISCVLYSSIRQEAYSKHSFGSNKVLFYFV